MPTLAIIGAGPNLGLATATRFGSEGFDVGLVARGRERLEDLVHGLESSGVKAAGAVADVRRPPGVASALSELTDRLGPVDVLLYSPLPSLDWIKPVADTTSDDVHASLELSVLGAVDAVQAVLPVMRRRGSGTLLFTTGGAAVAPSAERASSAISCAAEVAYARMLHEVLADEGIHVAHTAIVGALGPGLRHEPAAIAEVLWRRHIERGEFQTVCGG
ncbi:SDR family NAD(P)-dependent oxidoreductase [Actinoallomurus bryophytorum]|uniref:Short subunit dehydrogenase n=1 Tax=Actinoallomurus bryophytorum TaxID=1490222 RepID=A0A543BZE2_9ACTN|nr:SDR family NAD(P)-dependent oxidoreductase [Actinoallomurus bryophytorum]TQL90189.1 short subunit dehydrogenase [Actinoallomurus bryophytorum]